MKEQAGTVAQIARRIMDVRRFAGETTFTDLLAELIVECFAIAGATPTRQQRFSDDTRSIILGLYDELEGTAEARVDILRTRYGFLISLRTVMTWRAEAKKALKET